LASSVSLIVLRSLVVIMAKIRIPKLILKQILVCDKCVLHTFDKSLLENHKHIELHQCSDQCYESGLHQCPNCEYKVKHKHTITKHIRSVHLKIRHISCNICDFKTSEGVHNIRGRQYHFFFDIISYQYHGQKNDILSSVYHYFLNDIILPKCEL
jgi:DNA replication protein DnaC